MLTQYVSPCQTVSGGGASPETSVVEEIVVTKDDCIFCKIGKEEIPAKAIYEDDDVIAFNDIKPKATVHFLIIPKAHITSLADATPADTPLLGKMLALVPVLAKKAGCENGFRTVINTGRDGGQEVPHLHIHVLGGPQPWKK